MGKKAKWFGAVKKVFSPESKEKKLEKLRKKSESAEPVVSDPIPSESLPPAAPVTAAGSVPQPEEVKFEAGGGDDVTAPPEAASATAAGKSREEIAAVKIQTAFRGFMARRALRALRGVVRLRSLIQGNSVKRQAASTLRCMQTLARVQSQIRTRRLRMSEENQALQRQLLLKRERELESLRMGEEWDDSTQTKEQIEASLLSKQEAAMRRERALAYAFSHQWKSSSRSVNPMFIDPSNPQWGWSWLERWMASRPMESRSSAEKEVNADRSSVKSASQIVEGEITKAYANRDVAKQDKPSPVTPKLSRPASKVSPGTPSNKVVPLFVRNKSVTPKSTSSGQQPEDDTKSTVSNLSERPRRFSMPASTFRDDESLTSCPAVPSYMAPTESARAKSRFQNLSPDDKVESPDVAGSTLSIKKRLSFAAEGKNDSTPLTRRHSGPPKMPVVVKEQPELASVVAV